MTTKKPKTAEMKKMSELLPGGYSLSFSVDSETADQRIDRTVADAFPELSRSRIQHMAENGCITVNGKIVGKSFKPKADDEVSVYIEPTFVNFAVFNFADCCVTVGAALLIIKTVYDLIRENKKYLSDDDKKAENGGDEKNV